MAERLCRTKPQSRKVQAERLCRTKQASPSTCRYVCLGDVANCSMSNGSMSNGSMSNGSMSKLVEHSCQLTFFGKFSKKVSENRKNSSQLLNFYLKMTKNKKSYKKVSKKRCFADKI